MYSQLLDKCRTDIAGRERRHRIVGYAKLATAACGAATVWVTLLHFISVVWVLFPAGLLIMSSVLHEHLLRLLERRRPGRRIRERAMLVY